MWTRSMRPGVRALCGRPPRARRSAPEQAAGPPPTWAVGARGAARRAADVNRPPVPRRPPCPTHPRPHAHCHLTRTPSGSLEQGTPARLRAPGTGVLTCTVPSHCRSPEAESPGRLPNRADEPPRPGRPSWSPREGPSGASRTGEGPRRLEHGGGLWGLTNGAALRVRGEHAKGALRGGRGTGPSQGERPGVRTARRTRERVRRAGGRGRWTGGRAPRWAEPTGPPR